MSTVTTGTATDRPKRKKLRRIVREVLKERDSLVRPSAVTFRMVVVDFEDRTVTIDGRRHVVDARAFTFPILSGDVVVWPRDGQDIL